VAKYRVETENGNYEVETEEPSKTSEFVRGAAGAVASAANPVNAVKGLAHAAYSDNGVVPNAIAEDHAERTKLYDRAADDFKKGNYGNALTHAITGTVPFIGPLAQRTADGILSGDARKAGEAVGGYAAALAAPEVTRAIGSTVPKSAAVLDKATTGEKIGAESKALDAAGAQPDALTIIGELNKLRQENKTSAGVVINDSREAALKAVHEKVMEVATNPNTKAAVQDLQGIKRDLQDTARRGKAYNADAEASLRGEAAGDAAKALRQGIRNTPGGDKLNALDDQFSSEMKNVQRGETVGKWIGKVLEIPTFKTISASHLGEELGGKFVKTLQSPAVQNAPKAVQNEIYNALKNNDFKTASKITSAVYLLKKTDDK
jgi:hypothetical protein